MQDNITSRKTLKHEFVLEFLGSSNFEICALPADASFRKYDRVKLAENSFILMDCPKEYYSLDPFIVIAKFLLDNDFSAPKIFHIDHGNGFLLLEDFGDLNLGKYLLEQNEETKLRTYQLILELLSKLQSIKPLNHLSYHSKELLLQELSIFTDWYVPHIKGKQWDNSQKTDFFAIWGELLDSKPDIGSYTSLRDYHVENMMLLSRDGINSIGLLDFQDAVIGSPIYDVVSVLEDARFELSRSFALECLDYYTSQNKHFDANKVYFNYHLLGAQRNSRILGVFARKAARDKQQGYLKYIPTILKYLEHDLSHTNLMPLKLWMQKNL